MLWIAIMFAMVGAQLNMPRNYWIIFHIYIACSIICATLKALKDNRKEE